MVLKGVTDVDAVFDNSEFNSKSDPMSYICGILNKMQSKKLTIKTRFNFGYTYNLDTITIKNLGLNKLQIDLYQDKLFLEYTEEDTAATMLTDSRGVFAKKFTPQQIAGIMDRVKIYSNNNVQNNSKIRLQAIQNTKTDLLSLTDKMGLKDVDIRIVGDGLLDNDKVVASNIKYSLTNK